MESKKITVNGNEMTINFYNGCLAYDLDEEGNNTYYDDDEDVSYSDTFQADIYVNDEFIAYVNEDIYLQYTPYEAVKELISFGFRQAEALVVYNEIAKIYRNFGYYDEKAFEVDQKEEEYQKEFFNN